MDSSAVFEQKLDLDDGVHTWTPCFPHRVEELAKHSHLDLATKVSAEQKLVLNK